MGEKSLTSKSIDLRAAPNLSDQQGLDVSRTLTFQCVLFWLMSQSWHVFWQVLDYYAIRLHQHQQYTELQTAPAAEGGPWLPVSCSSKLILQAQCSKGKLAQSNHILSFILFFITVPRLKNSSYLEIDSSLGNLGLLLAQAHQHNKKLMNPCKPFLSLELNVS